MKNTEIQFMVQKLSLTMFKYTQKINVSVSYTNVI